MRAACAAPTAAHNNRTPTPQRLAADLTQRDDRHITAQFLKRQHGQLKKLSFKELAQMTPDNHRAQQDCSRETTAGLVANCTDISIDALQQLWINCDLARLAGATQRLAQCVLQLRVGNQSADGSIGSYVALRDVTSQRIAHLFRNHDNIAFPAAHLGDGLEYVAQMSYGDALIQQSPQLLRDPLRGSRA